MVPHTYIAIGQTPQPVKNTGCINKAILLVNRHTFYMHSDIDGFMCLVCDCLFRVHQNGESPGRILLATSCGV